MVECWPLALMCCLVVFFVFFVFFDLVQLREFPKRRQLVIKTFEPYIIYNIQYTNLQM